MFGIADAGDTIQCTNEYYFPSTLCPSPNGSTSGGWVYSSSTGCTFQGGTNEGVGAAAAGGTSGTTGGTGPVACRWAALTPDFSTQTCGPSTTITCFDSTCLCMAADGTFLAAFADAGVGDCVDNLSLCP